MTGHVLAEPHAAEFQRIPECCAAAELPKCRAGLVDDRKAAVSRRRSQSTYMNADHLGQFMQRQQRAIIG